MQKLVDGKLVDLTNDEREEIKSNKAKRQQREAVRAERDHAKKD